MPTLTLLMILLALAVLVAVAWLLARLSRYLSEGRSVFKGDISTERAHFFYAAFGLSEHHLRALHFDGQFFHVNGTRVPYTDVSSIACTDGRPVTVINKRAPHTTTWRHARNDGGPDRRYANNPTTMHATRYTLRFAGVRPHTLVIYDDGLLASVTPNRAVEDLRRSLRLWLPDAADAMSPAVGGEVADVIQRVNRFLAVAVAHDVEAVIGAYGRATQTLTSLQQEYNVALVRQSDVGSAAAAAQRLMQNPARVRDMADVYDRSLERQRAQEATVEQLRAALRAAQDEWVGILQQVRDLEAVTAVHT